MIKADFIQIRYPGSVEKPQALQAVGDPDGLLESGGSGTLGITVPPILKQLTLAKYPVACLNNIILQAQKPVRVEFTVIFIFDLFKWTAFWRSGYHCHLVPPRLTGWFEWAPPPPLVALLPARPSAFSRRIQRHAVGRIGIPKLPILCECVYTQWWISSRFFPGPAMSGTTSKTPVTPHWTGCWKINEFAKFSYSRFI